MSATLTSSQISPSGNLLLLRFGSNVASVAAGATYSVDGGAPIPLNYPQYDSGGTPNSDFVWYPLRSLPRSTTALDDSTDATLAGAGWINKNSGNTAFYDGYLIFAN